MPQVFWQSPCDATREHVDLRTKIRRHEPKSSDLVIGTYAVIPTNTGEYAVRVVKPLPWTSLLTA